MMDSSLLGTENFSKGINTVIDRFDWPLRVYYEDTDAGGVVYYANYLKFFERARTESLRAKGFEQDQIRHDEGLIFAVRRATVDYLKPARFNDALIVSADIVELKRASILFQQQVRLADDPHYPLCSGEIKIACLDAESLRPRRIPDSILSRIQNES